MRFKHPFILKITHILLTLLFITAITSLAFTKFLPHAFADATPTFTEFPLPSGDQTSYQDFYMTSGPDGNIWFTYTSTNGNSNKIGKMTPTGQVTEFSLPTDERPGNITAGPDGNLWFGASIITQSPNVPNGIYEPQIGRITPSGSITYITLPTTDGHSGLTWGPDGNIWSAGQGSIQRMTPNGTITDFSLPTATSSASDLVSGPNGNLWFFDTTYNTNYVDEMTTTGVITHQFPLPGCYPECGSGAGGGVVIAYGPDGNLWIETNTIGGYEGNLGFDCLYVMTPTGSASSDCIDDSGGYVGIRSGLFSNDNLWNLSNFDTSNGWFPALVGTPLSTITSNLWFGGPSGTIELNGINNNGQSQYLLPSDLNYPYFSFINGPDGNMWFAAFNGGALPVIIRTNLSGTTLAPTPTPTPPPTSSQDTGFRPSKDGFGFINQGTLSLTQDSFEQFFGKNATTTNNGELRASLKLFYNAYSDPQYVPIPPIFDYEHVAAGGNCFGISGASIINFEGLNQTNAGSFALPFIKYGYSSVTSLLYNPPGSQNNLYNLIGYYSGTQTDAQIQKILYKPDPPITDLNTIEQSIQNGKPIVIAMSKTDPNLSWNEVGHALVAYRYVVNGNTIQVYVYDSNHPANDGEYITFNLNDGSWYYNPDSLGPWGSSVPGGGINVVDASQFTEQGILPINDTNDSTIITPSSAGSYILNSAGEITGVKNGQLFNQISGVGILPTMDDNAIATQSGSQKFLATLGTPYTINIINTNNSLEPVSIFGNNAYISVNGLTPNASDSAQIQLGGDGKSATVSASSKISNYTIVLDQEISGKSLVFNISNASLNPGETSTFSLVGDNGELSIQNSGTDKTYTINIQEIGASNSAITLNNITIAKNMTQTWSPSDWDNLNTAPINLTENESNTITTLVANAVIINNGSKYTNSNQVTLHLVSPFSATQMRVSNIPFDKNQQFVPQWKNYTNSLTWNLLGIEGKQTVYVQFKEGNGTVGDVYSSSTVLDTLPPAIFGVTLNGGNPFTTSTAVQVKINAKDNLSGISLMKVSNNSDLSGASWQPYENSFNWTLTPLSNSIPQLRWVYIQLQDGAGNMSQIFKSPILLLP